MPEPSSTETGQVHELFARHGLRCTKQRRAIYEALAQSHVHPTADQIFHTVEAKVRGLSLATVYNALEALCRCGLARQVRSVTGGHGSARYDATTEKHFHLRCQRTGRIYDVPQDLGRELLDHLPREVLTRIEQRLGVKVHDVQIELLGQGGETSPL